MNESQGYKNIALKGGVVTGAAQALKMIISFASVIVLARLLTPTDFGLIASVAPVIGFVGLFQELGFHQAIVQKKNLENSELNQIFWILFIACLCCFLIIVFLSPAVSYFYGDSRLLAVTASFSLSAILFGLSTLPLGILNRNFKFVHLALIDLLGIIFGFIATVLSAIYGLNYWSLVVGATVTAFCNAFLSWLSVDWRPRKPDFKLNKEVFQYSSNLTGFNFVNFLSRNLDNVLIGKFVGATELGFYERAYKLLLFPIMNISSPIAKVAMPFLCKFQDEKERFRLAFLKTVGLVSLLLTPGIIAVMFVAEDVVLIFLGEDWLEMVPIFQWLALFGIVQPTTRLSGMLFMAQGFTNTLFKWGLISSTISILSFIVGLPWGAIGVAKAYALGGIFIQTPILLYFCHKKGPLTFMDFMGILFPYIIATFVLWIVPIFYDYKEINSSILVIGAAISMAYIISFISSLFSRSGRIIIFEMINNLKKLNPRKCSYAYKQ